MPVPPSSGSSRPHLWSMRDRLLALLETADLAVASCAAVLTDDDLAPLEKTVRGLRARLAYPEDVLVVALAGGTGSGKSSLFNVLVGEELADVGGVRPTTEAPEAAVPRRLGGALDGYLDYIGVETRHVFDGQSVCLLDLPDMDSVAAEHRERVDALIPLVDVIVWVTDPEKYRDARLHQEYLRPLAAYSSQFICVLNQSDRLSDDQLAPVRADLARALEEDGLPGVPVVATAAAPPAGPPNGIEELTEEFEVRLESRATLYSRMLIDLDEMTAGLAAGLGEASEFDERAAAVAGEAGAALAGGDTAGAIDVLVSFLDGLADATTAVTGASLRRVAAEAPAHVTRLGAEAGVGRAPARFFSWRKKAPDVTELTSRLNMAVLRPARVVLARHALARAAVAELALETASLRALATR